MWLNWFLLAVALLAGVAAIGVFVWAVRSGHFQDVEDAGFAVLRAESDAEDAYAPDDQAVQSWASD